VVLIQIYPRAIMADANSFLMQMNPFINAELREKIDPILEANKDRQGSLMVILNEIQAKIGFISEYMQQYISEALHIPVSRIHGVVTFYSFFTNRPRGKHTIKFCMGTACYVGGMPQIIEKAKQLVGTEPGQTTDDGNITLEICRCVGACSQAPVVVIDEEVSGRVQPNKFASLLRRIESTDRNA